MKVELLSCKICGKPPYTNTIGVYATGQHHSVGCNDCGIEVVNLTPEESAQVWNKLMSND